MARISGLEKNQAPWHLRWFYSMMRKIFGKVFTPVKIQMRLPALAWGGIAMEAGLGPQTACLVALHSTWKDPRAAARIDCPF
jgi:hypothetical protein